MKPMMNCSDDSLRLLLREDEQSDGYRDAARHVDSCPQCQQRIGELAAENDEWQEAHEMLLAGDDSGDIDESSGHKRSRGRWQRRPTAWTEAMARQLLSPPSHPEMLGRLGRYEVERLIGTGGMGVVFKAFDAELNRPVAVKLLTPYLAGSGAARKRFAREARAAAAVVHEHVVSIHNVETEGEVPFLVMQYVPGESLQCRLDREGALDVCEILRIGMQTASGLTAAHAQGLVHRDVKPSNVLLEKGVERSLLTDFGLARASDDASLTRSGHHPGTPQYMSPEQARGDQVDARSDLFSLGSVMYAMCTGRPPFRAESSYGVLRRITDDEPRPIREVNPNIPEWLERLIQKLLAKSLVDRFQTADEVAELLRQCLAHVQQPTFVPLPASLMNQAAGRRSNFNVTWIGVLAVLGTTGMALLGMLLMQPTEVPDISGQWASDEWGTVVLKSKHGRYEGTMSNALFDLGGVSDPHGHPQWNGAKCASCHQGPTGKIELKWSRGERRFNGTWRTSADRGGKMSIRLFDNEIRGAWTADKRDKNAQKESGTPRLADLLWKRSAETDGPKTASPLTRDVTTVPIDRTKDSRTDEDAEQVPDVAATIGRRNARAVVEAYVAAALAGRVDQAASLAQGTPAGHNQIESLQKQLNVQRLVIKSVYVNDPAKPTTALATSEAVKLTKKQPNGQRDGFMVLTLTMSEEVWLVTDVDFESEEGAEDELKRFRDANPMSIDLPPLITSSLPPLNPAVTPKYLAFEEKYRGTPAALKALTQAMRLAGGVADPTCAAAKGRVEAVDRLMNHYLRHDGIEKTFDELKAPRLCVGAVVCPERKPTGVLKDKALVMHYSRGLEAATVDRFNRRRAVSGIQARQPSDCSVDT